MARRDWLYLSLICLLAVVAYFGVWSFGFVYDDLPHLVNNQSIRSLTPLTKFILEPGVFIGDLKHPLNWRPVAAFAEAVSWNLFGDKAGYDHLVNLLLHLANLTLAYFLLLKLFHKERWLVNAATLIYGVHPILTESVDWISSQNTLLWTLFFLLAGILILQKRLKISYLFFALALLTKETAITGLLILPVFLWIQAVKDNKVPRPSWKEIARVSWPYFLIATVYLFLRWRILGSVAAYSYGTWLVTPMVFWKYVNLVFWPVHLIAHYDFYSNIPIPQSFWDERVIGGLFYAGIFIFWFWNSWKNRRWPEAFGLLWFLAFLVPVLQIIPFIDIFGERALYVPALGLILAILNLLKRWNEKLAIPESLQKCAVIALALLLAAMTFARSQAWRNTVTLWESAVKIDPHNAIAYVNLGSYYLKTEEYNPQKSIEWSQKLLDFWPDYAPARTNLGLAYEKTGDYDRAEEEFLLALSKNRGFEITEEKLAYLYELMGVQGGLMGQVTGDVVDIKVYGVTRPSFFRAEAPSADGSFKITLLPGTYYLKGGDLTSGQFTIQKDSWTNVVIDLKK